VRGRDGLTLTDKWKDGASTFHGLFTPRLPQPVRDDDQQSGFRAPTSRTCSTSSRATSAYIIRESARAQVRTLEASREAEAAWVDTIVKLSRAAPALPERMHARLLQQRGQARNE
jgi:hypothetical protein